MPFCEPCDRFYNPNTLLSDGSCPRCSTVVAEHEQQDGDEQGSGPDSDNSVPWHFWLVLTLVGLYLAWRLVQGVWWLASQAF